MSSDIKKFFETIVLLKWIHIEIQEWIQSLEGVVQREGKEGAKEILEQLSKEQKS